MTFDASFQRSVKLQGFRVLCTNLACTLVKLKEHASASHSPASLIFTMIAFQVMHFALSFLDIIVFSSKTHRLPP